MIEKGVAWGAPEAGPPDLEVSGTDTDLANAVAAAPVGVLVAYEPAPESDLARAVGLRAGAARQGLALPMDVVELADGSLAVNIVVIGAPPDRLTALSRGGAIAVRTDGRELVLDHATTVVVATGQWLHGLDLVPRGHPGDGRAEVHTYRIRRAERRAIRARLPTGSHLPHPQILTRTGVEIEVESGRPLSLEIDGRPASPTAAVHCTVVAARYRLLV